MNATTITKMEIMSDLFILPDNQLDKVRTYLRSLLEEVKAASASSDNLYGMWYGTGFENITDLDAEVKQIRQEMSASILEREL